MRLAVFGGGRERKIKELRARTVHLARLIAECQRALADCAPNDDDVGGYRAARRLRASLLESELATHRAELDALAAEIIELEAATRSKARERRQASSTPTLAGTRKSPRLFQRWGPRLGFIAATVVAGVILLVAVAPVEGALGLIPGLTAHEEDVIVVDPRTLSRIVAPPAYASAALPTPEVASAREPATSAPTVETEAATTPRAAANGADDQDWHDPNQLAAQPTGARSQD